MSKAGNYDLGAVITYIQTLTGDAGGAVGPDGFGNIDITGGNNITITGVPGTNSMTVDVTGTTQYAIQVGDATGSLDSLAIGTAGTLLYSLGAGANPSWTATTYPLTSTTGDLIYASANNDFDALAFVNTPTRYLANTGAGATIPEWAQIDLTNGVTGILPVPNGGTGVNTITQFALIEGDGVNPVNEIAPGTDGQILIAATAASAAFATMTSTDETIDITGGANTLDIDVNAGISYPITGFALWDGGAPYYDDTTLGEFTLQQSGAGYINGTPVTWTAPQTVNGLLTGTLYYIYIDVTGTLQKTDTFTEALFKENIILFECLRDSTPVTNNQITVKENHPYDFQPGVSIFSHRVIGPVIENGNNGANITLNGTQKIEIVGTDYLADHGLRTTIPDSGGVAETFSQYYTTAAGKWALYTFSDTFTAVYNNAGTVQALTGNKYGVYRLYVSKNDLNNATPEYFAVIGDAEYNNLTAAETAISDDVVPVASNELAGLELAQLGYIIFEESSNSIAEVIIEKESIRSIFLGGASTVASLITTDTTNFNHILSVADTTVQAALETIDDLILRADGPTDAQAAAGVFTLAGGTGVTTTGAASTVTIDLDTPVTVAHGGTGVVTLTDHGLLVGSGVAAVTSLGSATNGQIPIGSTGADPVLGTITGVGAIAVANGAGTISISGGGTSWTAIAVNQNIVNYEGYICNKVGLLTLTLPAVAAVGTFFEVTGITTDVGWRIAQGAGQQINFGDQSTTAGVTGYIESTQRRDSVKLVCVGEDDEWNVVSAIGNITIA